MLTTRRDPLTVTKLGGPLSTWQSGMVLRLRPGFLPSGYLEGEVFNVRTRRRRKIFAFMSPLLTASFRVPFEEQNCGGCGCAALRMSQPSDLRSQFTKKDRQTPPKFWRCFGGD